LQSKINIHVDCFGQTEPFTGSAFVFFMWVAPSRDIGSRYFTVLLMGS